MNKTEKANVVSQIKELLDQSAAVYLVDYSTVTVDEINEIRREFRKEDITYKVFKNTLFQKAIEGNERFDGLSDLLVGMTGFAFVEENFVAPAKLIKKFNGQFKKFNFKGCVLDSTFYGSDQLETLASMPTKEEIMASIVGSVAAPAQGIVGAINGVMRDIVSCIDQISKKDAA